MGALVVLIVIFTVLNPGAFLTLLNIRTILDQAAIPLVVGVGATLVVLMGSIDLSVEGVMGASGHDVRVAVGQQSRHLRIEGILGGIRHRRCPRFAFLGLALRRDPHPAQRCRRSSSRLGMWFVGLGVGHAVVRYRPDPVPGRTATLKAGRGTLTSGCRTCSAWAAAVVVVLLACWWTRFTQARPLHLCGRKQRGDRSAATASRRPGREDLPSSSSPARCTGRRGVLATLRLGAGSATVGIGVLFLTLSAVVVGGTLLAGGRAAWSAAPSASSYSTVLTAARPDGRGSYIQSGAPGACSSWPSSQRWPNGTD